MLSRLSFHSVSPVKKTLNGLMKGGYGIECAPGGGASREHGHSRCCCVSLLVFMSASAGVVARLFACFCLGWLVPPYCCDLISGLGLSSVASCCFVQWQPMWRQHQSHSKCLPMCVCARDVRRCAVACGGRGVQVCVLRSVSRMGAGLSVWSLGLFCMVFFPSRCGC